MSMGILCGQKHCREYGSYRYTWPGRDEAAVCEQHSRKLRGIADAMGLYLQLIPLTIEDHSNLAHPLATTRATGGSDDE